MSDSKKFGDLIRKRANQILRKHTYDFSDHCTDLTKDIQQDIWLELLLYKKLFESEVGREMTDEEVGDFITELDYDNMPNSFPPKDFDYRGDFDIYESEDGYKPVPTAIDDNLDDFLY